MSLKISFLVFLCGVSSAVMRGQMATVSGTVRDAATKEPLVAASIRVLGTTRGTITNTQGSYQLTLDRSTHTLIFSFIGYRADTATVFLTANVQQNVLLESSPVQMAEVVITGEDPAIAIMRKVIESKKRWKESLKTYQLEAFTRQTIRRDSAIAVITESYSTCYWQSGDTLREVIKQKRQTENIRGAQNFAGVGGIVNFYDDEIRFSGFKFVGPTSADAFDYYDFRLERTRQRKGSDVYDIKMTPKSRIVPLFHGSLNVVDGSYALAGVTVVPNEAFAIPLISELKLTYSQQFALFNNEFWMPVDIRIKGQIQIGLTGVSFPAIGFESIATIYDCQVNAAIPDSVFRKPRRIELKDASKFDSTYWAQREVLPLTGEEQDAYRRLDSTQTLVKQFKPSGALVAVGDVFGSSWLSPDLRFNRVEGLFLGMSMKEDSLTKSIGGSLDAGYGFSDERPKGRLHLSYYLDQERTVSVDAQAYLGIERFLDDRNHTSVSNIFSSLLYKVDYFDYYYVQGFRAGLSVKPVRNLRMNLSYRNENQRNAQQHTDFSLFSKSHAFRPNPQIDEGTFRGLNFVVRYGQEELPVPIIPINAVQAEVEYTDPLFRSTYDYAQILLRGEYHISTFLKSHLLPASLAIRLRAGTSFGTVPPQRIVSLDAPLIGYGPSGVLRGAGMREFSGDSYAILSLEHNFRSVPFLWMNIPFLYKNSVEFIVHCTVAKAWNAAVSSTASHTTDGIYSEAGFGISRIFGLLRVDYTRRLALPAGSAITFGIAMLL